MRRKPGGDVVVGEPLADQSHDVALGGGQGCPAAGGAFAFAAAALGVGDRLLGGQGRALGPCGVKVLLTQGISQHRHRGLVAGVLDLEADGAHALPDGMCRAEEPGGFAVTAGIAGQSAEALQDVGNAQIRLDAGGDRERVVGVAFGLFRLTLRDRHPGARRQRPRYQPVVFDDGVVGPAAGRDQIPTRQRGLRIGTRPTAAVAGRTLMCCQAASVASSAAATSPAARAAVANAE